jgi:acyl carrier protein
MQDRIRDILAAHGSMEVDPREVDDQADLYELGLTSLSSVNVMLALEDAFDVEFPEEVVKKSTFASVRNIEQVVEGLVKSSFRSQPCRSLPAPSHFGHAGERIWPDPNCYLDLWIETLHALGLDPVPALACALSADHDGLQFQEAPPCPLLHHRPLCPSSTNPRACCTCRHRWSTTTSPIPASPPTSDESFPNNASMPSRTTRVRSASQGAPAPVRRWSRSTVRVD